MRIATKISFAMVALAVCGILLAGMQSIKLLKENYETQAVERLDTEAQRRLRHFESQVNGLRHDALVLAHNASIQRFLTGKRGLDYRDLAEQVLLNALAQSEYYVQARILSLQGHELIRAQSPDAGTRFINQQLQDKSSHRYFREALHLPSSQVFISPIDLNREFGRIAEPHQPMLRASAPIYSAENLLGVLVINMSVQQLLDTIITEYDNRTGSIVNSEGYFIAHSNPAWTFGFDINPDHNVANLVPEYLPLLAEIENVNAGPRRRLAFRKIGDKMVIATSHHYDATNPDDHFILIQTLPYDALHDQAGTILRFGLLNLLILTLLAAGVAVLLSNLLVRRLGVLKSVAQRLAGGERGFAVPELMGGDEIADLSRAMRRMVDCIAEQENTINKSASLQRAVFTTAPCGIIVSSLTGAILSINEYGLRIFGYSKDELIGRNLRVLMPAGDAAQHDYYLSEYKSDGRAHVLGKGRELFGVKQNGEQFPLHIVVDEAFDQEQRFFVAAVEDISERRRQENKIAEFNQALAKSHRNLQEFVTVAAHDLQEPARKIQALGDLLANTARLDSASDSLLTRMLDAGQTMQQALCDLQAFLTCAALRQEEPRPVPLYDIAMTVRHSLASELEAAGLVLDIEHPLPTVFSQADAMTLLIRHLLSYSLRNHKSDKSLQLRLFAQRDWPVSLAPKLGYVGIAFSNPELRIVGRDLSKIFQPFSRVTDHQGSQPAGVDLSICRNLVEAHQGEICAEAAQEGLRILFFLPEATESE